MKHETKTSTRRRRDEVADVLASTMLALLTQEGRGRSRATRASMRETPRASRSRKRPIP